MSQPTGWAAPYPSIVIVHSSPLATSLDDNGRIRSTTETSTCCKSDLLALLGAEIGLARGLDDAICTSGSSEANSDSPELQVRFHAVFQHNVPHTLHDSPWVGVPFCGAAGRGMVHGYWFFKFRDNVSQCVKLKRIQMRVLVLVAAFAGVFASSVSPFNDLWPTYDEETDEFKGFGGRVLYSGGRTPPCVATKTCCPADLVTCGGDSHFAGDCKDWVLCPLEYVGCIVFCSSDTWGIRGNVWVWPHQKLRLICGLLCCAPQPAGLHQLVPEF
jgi:hypothetical protein